MLPAQICSVLSINFIIKHRTFSFNVLMKKIRCFNFELRSKRFFAKFKQTNFVPEKRDDTGLRHSKVWNFNCVLIVKNLSKFKFYSWSTNLHTLLLLLTVLIRHEFMFLKTSKLYFVLLYQMCGKKTPSSWVWEKNLEKEPSWKDTEKVILYFKCEGFEAL